MKRKLVTLSAIGVASVLGVIALSYCRFWIFDDAILALKTGDALGGRGEIR